MNTYFAKVLLVCFMVFAGGCVAIPREPSIKDYDDLVRKTTLLHAPGGTGSGVMISIEGEPYVLTAFHVIVDEKLPVFIMRLFPKDGSYDIDMSGSLGKTVHIDKSVDLALVKVIDPKGYRETKQRDYEFYFATVAKNPPKIGENIISAASPSRCNTDTIDVGTIDFGRITSYKQTKMMSSNYVNPGSSGGAIFNAEGELVGIIIQYTGVRKSISVRLEEVQKFLKSYKPSNDQKFSELFDSQMKPPLLEVITEP
jgi:S1-C subfamily serine protease